jgi:hypothetical protein
MAQSTPTKYSTSDNSFTTDTDFSSKENISPNLSSQFSVPSPLSQVSKSIVEDKTQLQEKPNSSSLFPIPFSQYSIPSHCGFPRLRLLVDIMNSHIQKYRELIQISDTPKKTLLNIKINMFLCLVEIMNSMYCSSSDFCQQLPSSQFSSSCPDRRRVTKSFIPIFHTMRDPILLQCMVDLLPSSLPVQQFYDEDSTCMPTRRLLKNLCEDHITTIKSCPSIISMVNPTMHSHITNDFILSTLTDHKCCFISNVVKIVNNSYILLHTSRFAQSYRSIIQASLIAHDLYYHKLPPFSCAHPDDDNDPDFPNEVCSICDIHSHALVHPRHYIDSNEYCTTYCESYGVTPEEFDALQQQHTSLS